jgi:hypothetical protein
MNIQNWMVLRRAPFKKDLRVCPELDGIVRHVTAGVRIGLVAVVGVGPSTAFDSHFVTTLEKLFNEESRYRQIFR